MQDHRAPFSVLPDALPTGEIELIRSAAAAFYTVAEKADRPPLLSFFSHD
jgi:hypothetical protein